MVIVWIIIIVIIFWISYHFTPQYRDKRLLKITMGLDELSYEIYEELLDKFAKELNKKKNMMSKKKAETSSSIESLRKMTKNLRAMEGKYSRLKERNVHKGVKKTYQLTQDWYRYLASYKSTHSLNKSWDWDTNDYQDGSIVIQEIERRFDKQLK